MSAFGGDLDPHRVAHRGDEVDVRAAEVAGALPHPHEVAGGVVEVAGARVDAGHRALVVEQQGLVRGEELGRAHRLEVGAAGVHELHRLVDVPREPLVAGVRGIRDEALVPVVDVAQVGEAAHREGAHEVQRRAARVVGAHEALGVGPARGLGELEVVDHVAAVGGQGDALAGLLAAAAGLGVLPRHPADLDDRHGRAVGEHGRHLQDRLDPVADVVGRRGREGLGAVPALEHERLAARHRGHPLLEHVALAREHERGVARERRHGLVERGAVGPDRLLGGRQVGTGGEPLAGVGDGRRAHEGQG